MRVFTTCGIPSSRSGHMVRQAEMARGFFAELQYQAKVAAREQAKAQREAERRHKDAVRATEQAQKVAERAAKQLALARAAEQKRLEKEAKEERLEREAKEKRLEKEAKEAHVAAMDADVERLNLELELVYEEIDSLLAATLSIDDYVDLDALKVVAEHPAFDRVDLEIALPPPVTVSDPPEPMFAPPPAPTGLRAFFGKKKHAKAVEKVQAAHERAVAAWHADLTKIVSAHELATKKHAETEAQRMADLERERARYDTECSKREADAEEHNEAIRVLIANLGYGTVEAVQEYISIVLSNSVYPDHFPVEHDFEFDPATAELRLQVRVPSPDSLPDTKSYKYARSSDEITKSTLSQKARKDRYSEAIHQVTLRSLHEVFESDRRGIIKTVSLEVGTFTTDPATGRDRFILFVATGAEREAFLELNLSNVVPIATLVRLGASISKNPFGLVAADASGIRSS